MMSAFTQSGGVGGFCGRAGSAKVGGSAVLVSPGFKVGDLFFALGDVGTYLHKHSFECVSTFVNEVSQQRSLLVTDTCHVLDAGNMFVDHEVDIKD